MTTEEAILGIQKHRERIHAGAIWSDKEALSDVMIKLSVYSGYLADNIAPLHRKATDKAYAVFTEAKAEGLPVTQAEIMSRGESTAEREEYENVKNVYSSTEGLMTRIQTRLRIIEEQIRREGSGL